MRRTTFRQSCTPVNTRRRASWGTHPAQGPAGTARLSPASHQGHPGGPVPSPLRLVWGTSHDSLPGPSSEGLSQGDATAFSMKTPGQEPPGGRTCCGVLWLSSYCPWEAPPPLYSSPVGDEADDKDGDDDDEAATGEPHRQTPVSAEGITGLVSWGGTHSTVSR